ncbi:MAG: dipeptide epimerase [Gammaproteobacteria bacterium]
MKIIQAKVEKHNMQLKAPWAIAGHVHESIENIFIEITDVNGLTGIGSCAPMNDSKENYNHYFKTLDEYSSSLIGQNLDHNSEIYDSLLLNLPEYPELRAAVDIALHDLYAKTHKTSLVQLLGQEHNSFKTSITIGVESLEKTTAAAQSHIDNGFSILKIKIGECVEEDIERVKTLFELNPENIQIRVDANRGYSKKELIKFYENTQDLGLELIEQPLEIENNQDMLYFPEDIRAICVADESMKTYDDAVALVKGQQPFGVFNIKLMKCGGIYQALKIAEIAEAEGIDLMWGCFDESKVSISGALHAALSCKNTKYIDLDGFFDLGWDLVTDGYICESGVIGPNNKIGIGVERG